MDDSNQITYFAETNARGKRVRFGIKSEDRTKHVYVIGKTGTGKSTMLENMAVQDIQNGNGFCFMDPHGKTADLLLEYIPEERKKDVLYFAPFDMEFPVSFNIMEDVGYDKRHLVVSGLMSTFKKIWQDAWSARMEYILSNTLFALLEYPDATLLSVNKMLADKKYRQKVVDNITDTSIKSFWVDEFANYTERFAAEATPAIQNKIGQFTSNPLVRNIIGQPKSSFDLRQMMDERKIVIVNLAKGRIGESNANLLGSLLITKIYLSAMSRADLHNNELKNTPNFYLYVDEFQSFANESFADILSEARKYKLNLTIAHQYIEQMGEEVRAAVFGNVGTMITFRVGAYDAEVLEKEFAPVFTAEDIVNLGFTEIYLRLMIDGMGSKPFSARTIPPLEMPESSDVRGVIDSSREQYSEKREVVEAKIVELVEMGKKDNKDSRSENKGNNQKNDNQSRDRGKNNQSRNNAVQRSDNKLQTENNFKNQQNKPFVREEKKDDLKKEFEKIKQQVKEFPKPEKEFKPVEQETVSLKELSKPRNDSKSATPENKNALKDALQLALKRDIENKNSNKVEDKGDHKERFQNLEKDNKSDRNDVPPNPNEIAEDKLRKILEV